MYDHSNTAKIYFSSCKVGVANPLFSGGPEFGHHQDAVSRPILPVCFGLILPVEGATKGEESTSLKLCGTEMMPLQPLTSHWRG